MSNTQEPAPPPVASDMQTDYTVGQDNIEGSLGPFGFDIHNRVFAISALSSVVFIILTLVFPDRAASIFQSIVSFSTGTLDSYFMIVVDFFIVFSIALAVLPYGKVRLGGPDAKPEYGYLSWFAMLFAAGIGIGLLFFGVLEPVYHANVSSPLNVPSPFGADGTLNPAAIADATGLGLAGTYLHWGIHGWAVYVVMALALSIFTYNKGLPFSIRSAFFPILGDRVWGWWGHIIDILAVFSTLFGLATSLGLGAQQANAGLNFVFGLEVNDFTQVAVILAVTGAALISVWRGLDGGVKRLSELNMLMAVVFFLFVLFAGPTLAALAGFWNGLETYVTEFLPLSAPFGRDDDAFRQSWTIFYWAWWISWAPFVGMFIARVSRGRTVREFVICVLLIPSLCIFLWMGVFGATALEQLYSNPAGSLVKEYVIDNYSPELSLFGMLNELPLSGLTSTLGIILALIFFITSSDSGSLVIDTITAGGKIDAPRPQRMFWATVEGLIAIVLLLGGGLSALQAGVTATAIPFSIVMLLMCYSIVKALNGELRRIT
ncbi:MULTISPECIES: BCCT family transporter [Halomonadaceae]|uniref:BCCT family transporter n=1 Tax=Halomonadaceae TaxID=28256 RepID=UPI001581A275|nr:MULTISPECIES: BCCT family transporter [Halomonas]MDI4638152.1 BCCT family transporter [Halomonas sp. BMC7]NUJ59152.1 BCCT family transporter [Halomonas taeanensis]|tara:strand:+ start:47291 stop:48928 length:1638 start_codon:yes stop_codon:yes gene_type:complete